MSNPFVNHVNKQRYVQCEVTDMDQCLFLKLNRDKGTMDFMTFLKSSTEIMQVRAGEFAEFFHGGSLNDDIILALIRPSTGVQGNNRIDGGFDFPRPMSRSNQETLIHHRSYNFVLILI